MTSKEHWTLKFLTIAFFGFVITNLMYLNFLVFRQQSEVGKMYIASTNTQGESENISQKVCDRASCVPALYNAIHEATASLKLSPVFTSAGNEGGEDKEYFISFGGGTSTSGDWADVLGLEASVDGSRYGNVISTHFVITGYIPTGNQIAYVRLFNKTDKHPVWFSDIQFEGSQAQLLVSKPITLEVGEKTYQVQMKSQLKFETIITQARLKIVAK